MTALQQDGAGVGWNVHTGRMGQCAALEFKISNVDMKVFFKKIQVWMDGWTIPRAVIHYTLRDSEQSGLLEGVPVLCRGLD